jgi:hypothetical protein
VDRSLTASFAAGPFLAAFGCVVLPLIADVGLEVCLRMKLSVAEESQ